MLRAALAGSQYVGVFARATDDCVVVGPDAGEDRRDAIAAELEVPAVATTVGGSGTVGALVAGNVNGLLVSGRVRDHEVDRIRAVADRPVARLPGRMNAAGNVVLANDRGAVVHPNLSADAVAAVRDALDVPVERAELGGVRTVGTAALATASGVLCHPDASDAELDRLEELLGVPADVGTINYGAPLVGAGLVANSHGYVVGEDTTGPELGRIEGALGYVE